MARLFTPVLSPSNGFRLSAWIAYRDLLTPEQLHSLQNKAQQEGMSLSAVAMQWGAPDAPKLVECLFNVS